MPFVLNDPTQTEPEIHVEDIGTPFVVTIYTQDSEILPLQTATSLTIRFRKPTGVSIERDATLYTNGSDGRIVYILEDGDIDVKGRWEYQAIVSFAGGTWHTNIVEFTVYQNIPAPS